MLFSPLREKKRLVTRLHKGDEVVTNLNDLDKGNNRSVKRLHELNLFMYVYKNIEQHLF